MTGRIDAHADDLAGIDGVGFGPLEATDAERCAELERQLFPGDGPWPAQAFRSELAAGHNTYLAARCAGRLIGYAGIAMLGPAGHREAEVHTIGVDPGFRGRGVGRSLLRRLLAVADGERAPVFLDVRTDNEPALGLYHAHGFEVAGLRRRYYKPSNADAYLMVRPAPDDDHERS